MIVRLFILNIFFGLVFAQSPDELLNSAKLNLDSGNLVEAESKYNSALQMDPTFAPAYMGLAMVAMRKGDLKQSQSLLKEAIDADPENKEFRQEFERFNELNTLLSKGKKSMNSGDLDDAIESFRIAYNKFPECPEPLFYTGFAHMRNKNVSAAISSFYKTLEVYPDHKNALLGINKISVNYFNKGNQLYKRGNLEGALSNYDEVLKIDKNYHKAYFQIGAIQAKLANADEAIVAYKEAIKINPQFYKGYFGLAKVQRELNDNDEALISLQTAIDIYPSYDKAYGLMGDIYIQQKDYDKAKQTLKKATTVNPNYSKGYESLGIIYSEEKNWNQAISSLEMAVALNEKNHNSLYLLSQAYNMNGDCDSALNAARKSTELKNRFGGAWLELGTAEWCNGSGNKAGALNAFEKARADRAWREYAEHEIDKIKNPQKYVK